MIESLIWMPNLKLPLLKNVGGEVLMQQSNEEEDKVTERRHEYMCVQNVHVRTILIVENHHKGGRKYVNRC